MKITRFEITNFRSLVDFKIGEFEQTTIFYGENNAGKSNVLNALNIIFSRKSKLNDENGFTEKENFYEGILSDFSNNFYNNNYSEPISFKVEIEVNLNQLDVDEQIESLVKTGNEQTFIVEAKFVSNPNNFNFAEMKVDKIHFNNALIYTGSPVSYFPTLDVVKLRQGVFNLAFTKLIDPLNDCVHIINSDRDMHSSDFNTALQTEISPQNFKSFLYGLYLSPQDHQIFERINDIFNSPPFSFGEISFAKDNGKLEIMVKNGKVRLPIKHIGSGVLQTLYILSSIIFNKSKIICIEELEQNLSPKKQYEALKKIQAIMSESHGQNNSLDQLILSSHSSVYARPKLGAVYLLQKPNVVTTISLKLLKQKSIKELNEHLAPAHFEYNEQDHKEMLEYLKKEHDF